MYTYDEALKGSIEYFGGDELAAKVFVDKYALRDSNDVILERTPEAMFKRIAKELYGAEKAKYSGKDLQTVEEFTYDCNRPLSEKLIEALLYDFKYIVMQGSPMYGLGNPYQYVTVGNCYVIPQPMDSYLGIMYTDTQITQITCRRGGVGWDNSKLRPKNTPVKNAAKTTSGMVSFAERFSNTIREVGQHGRRGASLQSLLVKHPDIFEFISVKSDKTKMTGSNISVKFTDEFMNAVQVNDIFELCWPVCEKDRQEMGIPENKCIRDTVKATDIWDKFIDSTWSMAEPGAMFVDTVLRESTSAPYPGFEEVSSNPCGEQNLPAYGCCRLLLQNLLSYVKNAFTKNAYFDYQLFSKHAMILQRLGDDLVDIDIRYMNRIIDKIKSDPEPMEIKQPAIDMWNKIIDRAIGDRRTGCGFTALGDAIAALGITYGSEESIEFCENMQKTFKQAAYKSSVGMSKVLGSFPVFDTKLDNKSAFIQRLHDDSFDIWQEMQIFGRRNMTLLTVAPTGSVSCLTRTTSGLEPVFKLVYARRKKGNPNEKDFRTDFIDQNGDHWMNFEVHHQGLSEFFKATGKTKIEDSPYYKSTANDIDWINRIKMQAALQKHIDNSISLTVNLPEDIDKETVSKIYFTAWKLGCKGCTIYRENCRTGVLVDLDKAKESAKITNNAKKRPESLDCDIYHISVKGKEFFCLIGLMDNQPYEVLAGENGCISKKAKKGKITKVKRGQYKLEADTGEVLESVTELSENDEEAITRLVSTSLRHHVDIAYIVHQLEKTKGGLQNFAKCISRVLKKYVKNGTKVSGEECKECGGELVRVEGCLSCKSCGYSKCS